MKANSIEGNKKNNITVIYTPWDNLKKTPGMETGQVTFHNHKKVKRVYVEKRINEVVNRLNKTKVERFPDLLQEKVQRDKIDRKKARSEEFAMVEKKKKKRDLFKLTHFLIERRGSKVSRRKEKGRKGDQ